jgi:hypothetical protein
VCGLIYEAVNFGSTVCQKEGRVVNKNSRKILKEEVVVNRMLSRQLFGGTRENHEKSKSG